MDRQLDAEPIKKTSLQGSPQSAKFFLLSYNATDNVGDEIQSLAARQFLPRVDYYVERERTNSFIAPHAAPVWGIMNGWFCHHPQNWPPSESISPLLVSMHIVAYPIPTLNLVPAQLMLQGVAREYLKGYEPIGARDLTTLKLFEEAGIDSYFSGCLTLTLDRPAVDQSDVVVLCDVPQAVSESVKRRTKSEVRSVSHTGYDQKSPQERFAIASEKLALYASARCVVTSRIHCALPCVAMGTPVLFLNVASDKGRFEGLLNFVHSCSADDFVSKRFAYDLDNPLTNPDRHLPFRAALSERVKSFVHDAEEHLPPRPYPLSAADRVRILHTTQSKVFDLLRRQDERIRKLEKHLT